MIKFPPFLKPNDTIGIVCPAGYMPLEKVQTCISVLRDWGYQVKMGKTVGNDSPNYFSGTDEERLLDFQQMLDDHDLKAILCGRGGYGISRIIDHINFDLFKGNPKWIIGFSDVTILHSHIITNFEIGTLHAPMAAAFNDEGYENEFVLSLRNTMEGKRIKYECPVHPLNKRGETTGELVGGNLSLLTHIIGSSSDIKTKGRILFLEDVGEYLYQIDRMFYQLKRNGKLDKLAGLIIGGFTELKDTQRPFGQSVYEMISDLVKEYDYPVCYGFPVSHEKENFALKIGTSYKLSIGKTNVILEE
jgi:muramoyltetrapeptide carboxypeptidase